MFRFFYCLCRQKWKAHAEVIEINPENQTLVEKAKGRMNQGQLIVNKAKWQSVQAYCKNKGLRFRIVNEKDLFTKAKEDNEPEKSLNGRGPILKISEHT